MIINPNSSLEMTAHLDRVLNKIKGEHTELTVTCPPNGPLAIESSYDEAMCAPGVLELVKLRRLLLLEPPDAPETVFGADAAFVAGDEPEKDMPVSEYDTAESEGRDGT